MEKPKKIKEHLLTEKRVYESFKNLKSVMRRTVEKILNFFIQYH